VTRDNRSHDDHFDRWFAARDSEPIRARHPVLGIFALLAFVIALLFTMLVLRLGAQPVEPSHVAPHVP
jgi:hypothetical protein